MSQTRAKSLEEICVATFTGLVGSFLISLATMHLIDDRTIAAAVTTALCTVWSLARGYAIRRIYNRRGTP